MVSPRAWNEAYPKVPEDFTITEKAPTIAFFWLKAPRRGILPDCEIFENLRLTIGLSCLRYILKDREEFFTGAQRSQIVWQILLRTPYDTARPDKVGSEKIFVKLKNISCI